MINVKGFYPEGKVREAADRQPERLTPAYLAEAVTRHQILEAPAVLCDEEHNMTVDLGCMRGVIRREDGAIGIAEGQTRDIALLSRVGKSVCFTVTALKTDEKGELYALLSRKEAQEQFRAYLENEMRPGDVLDARVTRLESFGAFCDIGCGLVALLPIDAISVSRISHPSDRFFPGQDIRVVLRQIAPDGKITVSHKELLGTWEENAALFSQRQTVSGVIRSVEEYGVFVELTPNLAGLAEPFESAKVGQWAGVYIKSILPEKMKIKLIVIDSFDDNRRLPMHYFFDGDHIDRFAYSPPQSEKEIVTLF